MVDMETETRLSRREAGQRMIALGQAFAQGSPSEIGSDSESIRLAVTDELEWSRPGFHGCDEPLGQGSPRARRAAQSATMMAVAATGQ
jgi:hypothetical protein